MDIESIAEVEEPKLEQSGIFSRADSVDYGVEIANNQNSANNPKHKSDSGLSMASSARDSISEASPEPKKTLHGFPSEIQIDGEPNSSTSVNQMPYVMPQMALLKKQQEKQKSASEGMLQ